MKIIKHITISLIIVLFTVTTSYSQRVGLVLSGGGAKGLYHVGIIKALEENDIPIDYVSGASMGAIVGCLYSAGYTPEEMVNFFKSDTVSTMLTGEIPPEYKYFFKKSSTTPEMITINLKGLSQSKGLSSVKLPTGLISTDVLDITFSKMMEATSWAAMQNFDSLVVPFRCTATDVYNRKCVVFKSGSLPFAVRSSMAIPIVFKPTKKDTTLLWDGGVINNYPWQCLEEDFKPDVFIGCICAGNEKNPKEDDMLGQITTMLTGLTDYNLPNPDKNITIKRRFNDIGTLDYDKAAYIIQAGYDDAMEMMPEIKEKIKRRADNQKLKEKRDNFRRKIKPLVFDDVTIDGITEAQQQYVLQQLRYTDHSDNYDFDYFATNYLRILSAGVFQGSFPDISYNPTTEKFQLHLHMSTKSELKLSFGGNISSTSLNQAYLGINYHTVSKFASSYYAGGLLGTFYNAFYIGGRNDFYKNFPFYLQYSYTWQQYDYTSNHMSRYNKQSIGILGNNINNEINMTFGASAFTNYIFKLSWTGARATYFYFPGEYSSTDANDETQFLSSKLDFNIGKNSFNYDLYPTKGMNLSFKVGYVAGVERYTKGTSAGSIPLCDDFSGQSRQWIDGEVLYEHYLPFGKYFTMGVYSDLYISNAPEFANDYATYFERKQFAPTPHSGTMFMREYRSASFLGIGVIPIVNFTKSQKFYLKTYAFCYLPQEIVFNNGEWKTPTMEDFEQKTNGIFGAALVYQTPVGPASVSFDKYTTGNNWCLMVNFGCSIFRLNKR